MRIIFCDSGFSSKEVDYMYIEEYQSARRNNFQISLISFEELKRGNVEAALKFIRPNEEKEIGIYRGWMLKPNQYEMPPLVLYMHQTLFAKKLQKSHSLGLICNQAVLLTRL